MCGPESTNDADVFLKCHNFFFLIGRFGFLYFIFASGFDFIDKTSR